MCRRLTFLCYPFRIALTHARLSFRFLTSARKSGHQDLHVLHGELEIIFLRQGFLLITVRFSTSYCRAHFVTVFCITESNAGTR
ncbi:hypothetical protein PLICRDRAFT_90165 [Plicaturopsis crispa FD-325 SS-3]|nr:hypothetical protein PLICRDRAFT_90165 [Plicaturopsis crispa FD-325 SS-3]